MADATTTTDRPAMRVLGLLITVGFFAALFVLLFWGKPATGGDALLVLVGSLGTAFMVVVNNYFRGPTTTGGKP